MRHGNGKLELCTASYSYRLYNSDRHVVLNSDNMDMGEITKNLELSALDKASITINEIVFEGGVPVKCHRTFFDYIDNEEMVSHAICWLAELSMTHRMMYMTGDGGIFVTESNDGQTNIDYEFLDSISRHYLGRRKMKCATHSTYH